MIQEGEKQIIGKEEKLNVVRPRKIEKKIVLDHTRTHTKKKQNEIM